MADMIGLLRFGMPVMPVPPVEPVAGKPSAGIAEVQSASGGGQANTQYNALPRPVVSPQFTRANTGDPAAPETESSTVLKIPEPFDVNVLTGPPPTFEATLLELEAHLRLSLARIDATRNAHPMDPKPAPEPAPEARPAPPALSNAPSEPNAQSGFIAQFASKSRANGEPAWEQALPFTRALPDATHIAGQPGSPIPTQRTANGTGRAEKPAAPDVPNTKQLAEPKESSGTMPTPETPVAEAPPQTAMPAAAPAA